jgi:hypothetical protein
MGTKPAIDLMGRIGCGATGVGVVDRLVYFGVWFGLSRGEELGDLLEEVELGLVMTLDQGLLLTVVGVALRLVQDEADEAVGEEGPRLVYHVGSSWRFTMDIVCCRLY